MNATVTTSYGTWVNLGDGQIDVETSVAVALGDFANEYDVPALIDAYRDAINDALPTGISLHGSEFYGPAGQLDSHTRNMVRDIVAGVGFWELAAAHELTDPSA